MPALPPSYCKQNKAEISWLQALTSRASIRAVTPWKQGHSTSSHPYTCAANHMQSSSFYPHLYCIKYLINKKLIMILNTWTFISVLPI